MVVGAQGALLQGPKGTRREHPQAAFACVISAVPGHAVDAPTTKLSVGLGRSVDRFGVRLLAGGRARRLRRLHLRRPCEVADDVGQLVQLLREPRLSLDEPGDLGGHGVVSRVSFTARLSDVGDPASV